MAATVNDGSTKIRQTWGHSRFLVAVSHFLMEVGGTGMAPASNAAKVRFSSRISLFSAVISGPAGESSADVDLLLIPLQLLFQQRDLLQKQRPIPEVR